MDKRKQLEFDLIEASKSGDLKKIKLLLIENEILETEALAIASTNGNLEIVKILVEKGINIHYQDEKALAFAAAKGHLNIVQYLIENGANFHIKNENALSMACYYGHLRVAEYLVNKGANIHVDGGQILIAASYGGNVEIMNVLVEKGVSVHIKNDKALRIAITNNHLELIKFFVIKCNVDPESIKIMAKDISLEAKEIIKWCETYINSKGLNEKLNNQLSPKSNNINKMKV